MGEHLASASTASRVPFWVHQLTFRSHNVYSLLVRALRANKWLEASGIGWRRDGRRLTLP